MAKPVEWYGQQAKLWKQEIEKNPKSQCHSIEALIIRQMYEPLSVEEEKTLQKHLRHCSHCQQFEQRLNTLLQSVQIPVEISSPIDKKMMDAMYDRIRMLSSEREKFYLQPEGKIRRILTHPVPLYQVVLGIVLLSIILIGIFSFPPSKQTNLLPPALSDINKPPVQYQLQVLDSLNILNQQRVGITVHEDTLLTDFLVSMM